MKIKNLPLLVGIALPILFILIISIVVFTPSFFIKPQFNFLYSSADQNSYSYYQGYRSSFVVNDGQLSLNAFPDQRNGVKVEYKADMPPLYLYDVKTDSSHQISFSEAQKYNLDPGPSSPDGYTVKYEYNSEGIFGIFGSSGNNAGYFFEKDGGKKKINGLSNAGNGYYYSSGSMGIIGW